jgi:hypothetical protein
MDRNRMELQLIEHQARRLRAEHIGDQLSRLVLAVDLGVRRVAYRIAVGLGGW